MNFHQNIVLCFILFITWTPGLTESEECVQRPLGACKVLTIGSSYNHIIFKDFSSPPPEGFALKMPLEINLLENKQSFENNLPVERKRPIRYNLDNAARVTIDIKNGLFSYIRIHLGLKYYRVAKLEYYNGVTGLRTTKYNRYTPILPTFPYNLHLEITTNGTFSIYADTNTEPFFEGQLTRDGRQDFRVEYIIITVPPSQTDLVAFVDCSLKHKPNCGTHRIDRLYGCRELLVEEDGIIRNVDEFQKGYGKGVIFDEFIVLDTQYSSTMKFYFKLYVLNIVFKVDSIQATLFRRIDLLTTDIIKTVRTKQWFEVPASPYAVQVELKTDQNQTFLKISNVRGDLILSLNLCTDMEVLLHILFKDPKMYFDCLNFPEFNSTVLEKRTRKFKYYGTRFEYNENGYNYTKTLLDTRKFVSEPSVYQYEFGNTTQDWCKGEPLTFLQPKYDNNSLQAVIERSSKAIRLELQKINAQNNATNAELRKINTQTADTNAILLSEFRSVKASIDALATHLQPNTTTISNDYKNKINVTDFFKKN